MEEAAYRLSTRMGRRLFERTPSGLTVIQSLGAEAIVATGYKESPYVNRAFSIAQTEDGLQVAVHRMYGMAPADCKDSSCVSVKLMDGVTEVEAFDGSEMTMPARLRAQSDAHSAIEHVLGTGRDQEHNPFLGGAALRDLHQLAEMHSVDAYMVEALAEHVN